MKTAKHLGVIVLTLVVSNVAALAMAQAETVRDHRRVLGGVNLSLYCANKHGRSVKFKAINIDNTSGGWRCTPARGRGYEYPISVQAACRQQYGRNDLLAEVRSSDDSWVCINPRAR